MIYGSLETPRLVGIQTGHRKYPYEITAVGGPPEVRGQFMAGVREWLTHQQIEFYAWSVESIFLCREEDFTAVMIRWT